MPNSLSVVIIARRPANLQQCIQSVIAGACGSQVHLFLEKHSRPGSLSSAAEGRVIVHQADTFGEAVAQCNALVPSLQSDLVAFIDGDAVPEPGWAKALLYAADQGAALAAGPVESARTGSAGIPECALGHDPAGGRCFFPYASHANLAIKPGLFGDLGGFDRQMATAMGADLSFRAQLDGHSLSFVPAAKVVNRLCRRQLRRKVLRTAHDSALLDWKYHRFAFYGSPFWAPPLRLRGDVTRLGLVGVTSRLDREAPQPTASSTPSPSRLLAGVVSAAVYLKLLADPRRPPKFLLPRSTAEAVTCRPLPALPVLGIVGRPAPAVTALGTLVELKTEVAVPPPLRIDNLAGRWDEPAPWSLWLARQARRSGWDIPQLLAARRLEHEFPKTLGEAVLSLHAIYAQLHGKNLFGLMAPGPEGIRLAELVGPTAVMGVGARMEGVTALATPYEVLRHPGRVAERVRNLLNAEGLEP